MNFTKELSLWHVISMVLIAAGYLYHFTVFKTSIEQSYLNMEQRTTKLERQMEDFDTFEQSFAAMKVEVHETRKDVEEIKKKLSELIQSLRPPRDWRPAPLRR